jgi:hypothetical protein
LLGVVLMILLLNLPSASGRPPHSSPTKQDEAYSLAQSCLLEIVGTQAFADAEASAAANYCIQAAMVITYADYLPAER